VELSFDLAATSALPPVLTSACQRPPAVTEHNADLMGNEQMESVSHAMSDLIALAFACDLTRVVSYMFTGGVGGIILVPHEQRRGVCTNPIA